MVQGSLYLLTMESAGQFGSRGDPHSRLTQSNPYMQVIIVLDNGWSPLMHQAIIWTNYNILSLDSKE